MSITEDLRNNPIALEEVTSNVYSKQRERLPRDMNWPEWGNLSSEAKSFWRRIVLREVTEDDEVS